MSAKNRKNNLKIAKAQRQKKIAIVLGALFAVLLVVQVPKTLKKLHGSSSPAAAPVSSSSRTPGTPTPAAPASSTTLTAASSSAKLPESDLPPRRSKSQLFSFERFRSKDPFAQQVSDATAGTPAYSGTAPAVTASSSTAGMASSSSAIPATTQAQPAQPATAATPIRTAASVTAGSASSQKVTAAVIEVNGQPQTVGISQAFPQASPTFRLVSARGQAAMIGIAGGSFASGNKTLTLRLGKTLTLMNTSGGQRYELRLVSVR
jgi:hypothetical protein